MLPLYSRPPEPSRSFPPSYQNSLSPNLGNSTRPLHSADRVPTGTAYGFFYGDNEPRKNLYVRDRDGRTLYVAEMTTAKKGVPDVVLRAKELGGPVVGTANFGVGAAVPVKLELGAGAMSKSKKTQDSKTGDYGDGFRVDMRSANPSSAIQTLELPTRHLTFTPFTSEEPSARSSGVLTWTNYRIDDTSTSQAVAMCLNGGRANFKKVWTLEFHQPFEEKEELLVILGTLAMVEKARRKAHGKSTMGMMFNFTWS